MDTNNCINCGKCTKACAFLKKYNLSLKDYAAASELAYHCFLCGECKRACPVHIDGRQISLDLRRENISKGYRLQKDGYGPVIFEKRDYIFRNYRHALSGTALFPGCNFPAFYPKTTSILSAMMFKKGIGVIFDCCGKPVSELGLKKDESKILDGLNKRFKEFEISELIILCPNCLHYLKDKIDVRITNIYEKLSNLGMASNIDVAGGSVFVPCPERDSGEMLSAVESRAESYLSILNSVQCCGAGGLASVKEKDAAESFKEKLRSIDGNIYTYCATCSGTMAKANIKTEHILCKLLGVNEAPAKGIDSLLNRALFKLK